MGGRAHGDRDIAAVGFLQEVWERVETEAEPPCRAHAPAHVPQPLLPRTAGAAPRTPRSTAVVAAFIRVALLAMGPCCDVTHAPPGENRRAKAAASG